MMSDKELRATRFLEDVKYHLNELDDTSSTRVHSVHEAYARIKDELDELWAYARAETRVNQDQMPTVEEIKASLVDIAYMCCIAASDLKVCDARHRGEYP